ncbi:MAG: AraC family transcriptional regulator, partial [Bacteroidales bacterium]|nr:AraC family transcriptional regulator [Bacteroidales bacterium]
PGAGNPEEHAGGNRKIVVHQAQRDKIANDIMRIMETTDDYCAMDYNIDKLAASIHSNARYVSEVINDTFGRNFRDLLNEYRIKVAMVRLNDIEHYGHLTIQAISESVGYKSQATFITAFTKFTGLKPSLYQKLSFERYKKNENGQAKAGGDVQA